MPPLFPLSQMLRLHPLAAVTAVLVSACDRPAWYAGDPEHEGPHPAHYGGTAVVASVAEIPTLNPLFTGETTGRQIQQFVLFTPVLKLEERSPRFAATKLDEKFEPAPALAKSWTIRPIDGDSTELTFHLRDDVFWHDGVRTTAYDLKFAYDLLRTPPTGSPNATPGYGEALAVDSFTFRVKLKPHVDFLQLWRAVFPLPRHLLHEVPPTELREHPFGTERLVGNGPFRFASRDAQGWTFEANESYPEALGGRPYLDRIVYRTFADRGAALGELLAGRVDYLVSLSAQNARQVAGSASARLETFPSPGQMVLAWNMRRRPFDDERVRRALTLAIDRRAIIDGVLHGYGQLANSPVPPIHWAYDASVGRELAFDPDAARTLLEEAGWEDRDGDGVIEDAGGRPFRFTALAAHGDAILGEVAKDLREVGIEMGIELLDLGVLLERIGPGSRDFDAVSTGIGIEFRVDVRAQFHCRYRDDLLNLSGYCNREADRLMDTTQAIVDHVAARQAWQRLQQRIAHDHPHTFLYFAERLVGVSDRLQNTKPDPRGEWQNAARWWIRSPVRR